MTKIAITGATGQLGQLIITELLTRVSAETLIAVVRTPAKASDFAKQGIAIRQADYDDVPAMVTAFTGIDKLMFISNMDIPRRKEQHDNVIEAAKTAGVPHIIYTSFVDSDLPSPLAQTHFDTEAGIIASGIAYTFLRNNFYMDAYTIEVEIAMQVGAYRTPTASDVGAAFVSRADIARAAATVLANDGHSGKTYNLTGNELVTPTVFATVASALSNREVIHQQITWDELAADYAARGMSPEYVDLSVMLEKMIASGVASLQGNDIELITGKAAETMLEFCQRTIM